MRRTASLLVWFALLFGFWELLVGTFQLSELLAGLIAAGAGALFAELARALGVLEGASRDWLRVWKLSWQLPVEFLVVAWALIRSLARGRRVRGRWLTVPYDGDAAAGIVLGTATPNAIVVDVRDGEGLIHTLEPDLPGGRRVL